MPVLYLTEAEVRQILTMELAIPAVEASLRKISLDEAVNIPRQRCQTDQVMLHVLPAAVKTLNAIGLKVYSTAKQGTQFHVMLYDAKVGGLIAMIEADYLGQVRTGAASASATKKLARANAETVGVYGTGKQARTQLEGVCKVRKIRQAKVYSRSAESRQLFAQEMAQICQTEVIPVETPEEAAKNLDIVITATTSREPVLHGEWLAEGTHLNIIGSNFLAKAEVDVEVFRRAQLVTVDSKEQAKVEAGDFVAALKEGVLQWSNILDYPHILTGRYPGRESPQDITVFKSLGLGVEDIAVGMKVLEVAKAQGLGRDLGI
jgi:alanine dehydrogenase